MKTSEELAFVAGATGLTGRHLVRSSLGRAIRTVAHVRPDSSRRNEWSDTFRGLGAEVSTAAWEPEAMRTALEKHQPTLVFALLGTTRARARQVRAAGGDPATESYEAVDYGLSALLLHATELATPNARFVYLSSMGVSSTTSNAYLRVRHRLEKELRESKLSHTIARPSFIVGERDSFRPGEAFGAATSDGLLTFAGWFGASKLRDRYTSMRGEVLARALLNAALDPAMAGRTLEADALRRLGAEPETRHEPATPSK